MNAEEMLLNAGHDGVVYFASPSYDDALVGVSSDEKAIYDYEKMINWLIKEDGFTELEAMEWIDYNVIRALPYIGDDAPIVMMPIDW